MAYSSYISTFLTSIGNYMGRSMANVDTSTGGTIFAPNDGGSGTYPVDNLLGAVNDARRAAQSDYGFQQLRIIGAIKLNGAAGAPYKSPSGGYGPYTSDAPGTALNLDSIDTLWNYSKDTSGNMLPTNKIDFASEGQFKNLLPTNMGYPFTQIYPANPPYYYNTIPSQQMFAYVVGQTLYVNTCNAPSWFMFFGTQQLPDLVGTETSDFFIDNYSYWLRFAAINILNSFLKEDQRVVLSQRLLEDAWNRVCFDDAGKGAQGEWSNLD